MTLSEKFESAEQFIAYSEQASGKTYDAAKVKKWFNENPDFVLSYTGVMQVLNTMATGIVPKPEYKAPVVEEETPTEE